MRRKLQNCTDSVFFFGFISIFCLHIFIDFSAAGIICVLFVVCFWMLSINSAPRCVAVCVIACVYICSVCTSKELPISFLLSLGEWATAVALVHCELKSSNTLPHSYVSF